ncbi:hypothetical protein Tco_0772046 [Tanacetum coccineum]|uniref:Uncharacterized protein n=1 Tax=Tanacetum coccineum TaxID=301880 RepID=A0ABQ4ZK67_9ASTR
MQRAMDCTTGGWLRKMSAEGAWNTIKELVQYEEEEWDDQIFSEKGSLDNGNANMEQILENMEYQVNSLMKYAISLLGISEKLLLGKPFVEVSNMTYDPSLGIVKFIIGIDEVAYQMAHKKEQF